MLYFLAIGLVLGLSAGLAPGPLLVLVISETLQHDIKSGVKAALAPIVTDLPIIILSFFVFSKLSNAHKILGMISLFGGFFLLYIGCATLSSKGIDLNLVERKPNSLVNGVLTNALNPHPYLFWLSVGTPTMIKAMRVGLDAPAAFIISFYSMLVGAKIGLAIFAGKSKSLLKGKAYTYTLRFLGFVLCFFAVLLFYDGIVLLEIV